IAAAKTVTTRTDPPGERFNYTSSQTAVLGLVLRRATHRTLCDYIDEKIWKPIGAESEATWLLNPADGTEIAMGSFNAT
ncbi:serine hydrolase, partial [Clostridium perfringens]